MGMGFLDKIKQQATDVATTVVEKTTDTAKTGQLQMQLRSLKGEEKEALADLGAAMIALGETPTSLADQTTKVHELRDRISEKEQEIADVRAESAATADPSSETVESEAEEVADTPPPSPPADGAAPDEAPAG
jgi:TolA-binding protein